jgi:hypothetical protein
VIRPRAGSFRDRSRVGFVRCLDPRARKSHAEPSKFLGKIPVVLIARKQ